MGKATDLPAQHLTNVEVNMFASAGMYGVRVDLTPDEAMAVVRFLKARRVGGAMVSTDFTVIEKLEAELASCAVGELAPVVEQKAVLETHKEFIEEMCPSVKNQPTLKERMLASFEDSSVLVG